MWLLSVIRSSSLPLTHSRGIMPIIHCDICIIFTYIWNSPYLRGGITKWARRSLLEVASTQQFSLLNDLMPQHFTGARLTSFVLHSITPIIYIFKWIFNFLLQALYESSNTSYFRPNNTSGHFPPFKWIIKILDLFTLKLASKNFFSWVLFFVKSINLQSWSCFSLEKCISKYLKVLL